MVGCSRQEAAEKLEAARKQGTGWVKVDKDLVARVQSARQKVDAALQKAVRPTVLWRASGGGQPVPPDPAAGLQPRSHVA